MSKSTKSASTIKARVKKKYIRDRTLKRGAVLDGFQNKYIRRCFAAYKLGELPSFEEGLSGEGGNNSEFGNALREMVRDAETRNIQVGFLLDRRSLVGLVNVVLSGHIVQPAFHYFSWATPRNKLETALRFFIEIKQHARAMMTVPKKGVEARMLSHLGKYGCIRGIGTFKGFYDDGDALFFQTIGK